MRLKWDLKDSTICLDLTYFQPQNNQKNNFLGISGSSLHFFDWRSKFIFEKRIRNTFQIRGDKTQKQQNSLKTK